MMEILYPPNLYLIYHLLSSSCTYNRLYGAWLLYVFPLSRPLQTLIPIHLSLMLFKAGMIVDLAPKVLDWFPFWFLCFS